MPYLIKDSVCQEDILATLCSNFKRVFMSMFCPAPLPMLRCPLQKFVPEQARARLSCMKAQLLAALHPSLSLDCSGQELQQQQEETDPVVNIYANRYAETARHPLSPSAADRNMVAIA